MTLKTRLILVSLFSIVLVTIVQVVTGRMAVNETEERFEQATITGKSVLWRKIINGQLEQMANGTRSLTRDRDSIAALKAGDRTALDEALSPTFNRLSSTGVVSRIQVVDLNGTIMASMPQKFSGSTNNPVIRKALATRKVQKGVAADEDGSLVTVYAFPLYSRGKIKGAGVYMRDIGIALTDFKNNDGSDVFIFNVNGKLQAGTSKKLLKGMELDLADPGKARKSVVDKGDNVFAVVSMPVKGVDGKVIGSLVSLQDFSESYAKQQNVTLTSMLITVLVVIALIVGLYFYMTRAFRKLHEMIVAMETIATGDLTVTVGGGGKDETGKIVNAMGTMLEHLKSMVQQISGSTDKLVSGAEDMSRSSAATSSGMMNQKDQTDMVATAMNEMTATVQEVARSALQAADAAKEANAEAQNGNTVVQSTISSIQSLAGEVERASAVIHRLEEDADNIGTILDVIKGIAEQTNLLALNAAIEAARAGEQGRGFAVVADEVRTLASRTQQSTEDIQKMIESLQAGSAEAVAVMEAGQERAEITVKEAAEAGSSLGNINSAINVIVDMNSQIASAAEEQNAVAEEINRNIISIVDIADSTLSQTQETMASTEQMNLLADELRGMVSKFKT